MRRITMKLRISFSTLLIGLFVIIVLLAIFILRSGKPANERNPEISSVAARSPRENIREIQIRAKQFSFSPNQIKLKLNEQVKFLITSEDVTHGFSLPDFGIDQAIEPGKETMVDFHASRKGTFSFVCSVTCGTGHSGMRGTIIIE